VRRCLPPRHSLPTSLKPETGRPPFRVLVMSEETRLGREAIETALALKQLVTAGVPLQRPYEPLVVDFVGSMCAAHRSL